MNHKPTKIEVMEFLKESNAIEGVYDELSLADAKLTWNYLMKHDVLTPAVILHAHKLLMLHQRTLWPNEKGYFRSIPVWIAGREGIDFHDIEREMHVWIGLTMMATKGFEAFGSLTLHVHFENIHPFVDGNGRLGRMLMNWTRLKVSQEPIMIIKEADRQTYYQWFKR